MIGPSPDSAVRGRRALVTGAASGIGLAVARQLRVGGAELVVSDLPGPRLDAVAAELGGVAAAADLGAHIEVHGLAEAAGDVDILVNNAGLQYVSPIEAFDEARWDQIIAVMLTAPFLLTKGLLRGMYERGWGRVINIASVHGLVASPFKSAYVSAKHGLIGFTKTLALEAAQHSPDVTAHAIAPSYVRTPLVERQIADQARAYGIPEEEVLEKVMLPSNAVRQLIEPEDVAAAVEWLCGPAAWTMTGSVLTMDAGWLAH
jgi:3-hydroxybutyrate dehydrogenase